MNSRKILAKIGFVSALYFITGPIGLKTYFIGSAVGYHIHAARSSKMKTFSLQEFKSRKMKNQMTMIIDWRGK